MSMAQSAELRRIARELEAMHELIRVLMAEIQELKEQSKEQKRGPGRPPKEHHAN